MEQSSHTCCSLFCPHLSLWSAPPPLSGLFWPFLSHDLSSDLSPSLRRLNPPESPVCFCHIIYLHSKKANRPPTPTPRSPPGDHRIPHLPTPTIHHRWVSATPPCKKRLLMCVTRCTDGPQWEEVTESISSSCFVNASDSSARPH